MDDELDSDEFEVGSLLDQRIDDETGRMQHLVRW